MFNLHKYVFENSKPHWTHWTLLTYPHQLRVIKADFITVLHEHWRKGAHSSAQRYSPVRQVALCAKYWLDIDFSNKTWTKFVYKKWKWWFVNDYLGLLSRRIDRFLRWNRLHITSSFPALTKPFFQELTPVWLFFRWWAIKVPVL